MRTPVTRRRGSSGAGDLPQHLADDVDVVGGALVGWVVGMVGGLCALADQAGLPEAGRVGAGRASAPRPGGGRPAPALTARRRQPALPLLPHPDRVPGGLPIPAKRPTFRVLDPVTLDRALPVERARQARRELPPRHGPAGPRRLRRNTLDRDPGRVRPAVGARRRRTCRDRSRRPGATRGGGSARRGVTRGSPAGPPRTPRRLSGGPPWSLRSSRADRRRRRSRDRAGATPPRIQHYRAPARAGHRGGSGQRYDERGRNDCRSGGGKS